ncbi:cytochrome b6f complex subunit (petM) [Wolffia australiana]
MAASLSSAAVSAVVAPRGGAARPAMARRCVGQLGSFGGLKAQNSVSSLGQHDCADRSFARVVSSLRPVGRGKGKGGAFSATANAAQEIFSIASIMGGLVLVGVAVGFVLLRVEAWVEESEAAE